jgi:hypothetical protein
MLHSTGTRGQVTHPFQSAGAANVLVCLYYSYLFTILQSAYNWTQI